MNRLTRIWRSLKLELSLKESASLEGLLEWHWADLSRTSALLG